MIFVASRQNHDPGVRPQDKEREDTVSEDTNAILSVLQEMRDILRDQADRVSSTLQSFADVNNESNRRYQESQKAYKEAQETYTRKMERSMEKMMLTPAWRAYVFVFSIAAIAVCMVVNLILKFIG